MGIYFIIAGRNLIQARRRSLLLGFALATVTMLLVLLLSWSNGIADTMIRSATALSSGHVNVSGFYKTTATDAAPMVTNAKVLREAVEELAEGVEYIVTRQRGWSRIVSDLGSVQSAIGGLDIETDRRFLDVVKLAAESEYKENGREIVVGDIMDLKKKNHVLLFVKQAKRLRVEPGDKITVTIETMNGMTNSVDLTVAAVGREVGLLSGWNIYLSQETVLSLYDLNADTAGAIMIYLKDVTRSNQVMKSLSENLKAKGYRIMEHDPNPFWMKFDTVIAEDWVGQKLDLTTWRDEISFLTWILKAIDSVSFLLISILLVIISVGIMNAMWISVRERTKEVGTVRALGMSKPKVLLMFMTEALLLGFISTTIGALIGAGFATALDAMELVVPVQAMQVMLMSDTLHFSVKLETVLGAVAAFTLLVGLAALWPAYRASQLQPVTAIHHVG
jgi:putative ABC transport system permease protein